MRTASGLARPEEAQITCVEGQPAQRIPIGLFPAVSSKTWAGMRSRMCYDDATKGGRARKLDGFC